MDQLTTTQSKSRFRPVNISAAGLPGGPLPVRSVTQDPTARPAVIRTVVNSEGSEPGATVQLLRQDEMSQPKPRMLPEQRLEKYVQKLRATKHSRPDVSETLSCESQIEAAHRDSSIVTWSTPQASRAINLSDAVLTKSDPQHFAHPAHVTAAPHLQGWPDQQETATNEKVEAQLEQATALDQQLRQLELRIENLRVKEEVVTNLAARSAREKEILANPHTGELVTAISTAIVSALQEKPETEVLPKAKSLFEQSLQQHSVTLDQQSVAAARAAGTDESASEAMFSAIAAQRQQAQQPITLATSDSPIGALNKLRERIGDYQRMMTRESTGEAATLVKLTQAKAGTVEPLVELPDPPQPAKETIVGKDESPLVQFIAPKDASVPFKIASWDVEDFRWASAAKRMLDNGGTAITNLLDVTLNRTTTQTKRVVVAGAGRGQGVTTIAVSLARAANAAGYRTLLIDADVASPELSEVAGLSAKMSWLNGIGSDHPIGESVIRSKKTNLCLMPLVSNVQRVTWPRFIFDNLGEMMGKAESYFDLVLIDAGPVSQLLDELSSPELLLDSMVLVDSNAKLKEIEVYQNRLQTFGVNNIVLAENRRHGAAIDAA